MDITYAFFFLMHKLTFWFFFMFSSLSVLEQSTSGSITNIVRIFESLPGRIMPVALNIHSYDWIVMLRFNFFILPKLRTHWYNRVRRSPSSNNSSILLKEYPFTCLGSYWMLTCPCDKWNRQPSSSPLATTLLDSVNATWEERKEWKSIEKH